ncbi:MAG: acyl-ACP--UDP-N-acetylglucosamine O-acyltransferase [Syntrophobacteraceae bacterium]|nr:acyl-ACP--UDP-N-acetylglucosamine O-acyltransferase [Syntrophobacteraceae bacterium]
MVIHPTAIISPSAELAEDVTVEAYSVIGPDVVIGAGTVVGHHIVIEGKTTIGENNRIFPFASIGLPPQDVTYADEDTSVSIGNNSIIREYVTIHRGTVRGHGVTRIGDGVFLMAYCHVAHDCQVGNGALLANSATLGGHVDVGEYAVIGGIVAVHQFVRLGEYSCTGGFSAVRMDIAPYMLATGAEGAKLFGPNLIGLKRRGFSAESIQAIKKFYKIFFRSGLTLKDAIVKVREEVEPLPEVERLIEFVEADSKRGLTR